MESGNKRANHDAAPFAFFIVIYERFSVVNKKNPKKNWLSKKGQNVVPVTQAPPATTGPLPAWKEPE